MKDNKKNILKIILFTVIPILIIVMLLSFLGSKLFDKSYSLDEGMNNISAFVDGEDNPTSVSFILEYLDHESKENIDGNEVEVVIPAGITAKYYNIETNEEIEVLNNKVTLSDKGTIVKLNGIAKNNTYNIVVKPTEKRTGLMPMYKEANIEIDYTNDLSAKITSLIDRDGNNVDLSDNDKIVFLFTDSEDKIKLRNNSDVEISYYYSLDELTDEELAEKTFTTYNKDEYLSVSTNGYLYAKSKYKTSGYSRYNVLRIDHIDKLNPVISNSDPQETPDHRSATVTFNVSDATETKENGKSGIHKYAFSITNTPEESEYIEVNQDNTYTRTVNQNGTYYVVAYDNAGNKTTHSINVSEISWDEVNNVLLILQASDPDLVGKEYRSLRAMKEDFESHGLTNTDGVLVQLEGNITNQHMLVENVNLTIDLNGYTINTNDYDTTFEIGTGATFKIVDNKLNISDYLSGDYDYTHGSGYGRISNSTGNSLKVNQDGILTIGEDNSPDLVHIEYPDHNSPLITANNVAIVNNGTIRYYDGVLKGKVIIDGQFTDTPPLYDPNVVDDGEGGYISTLEKVSGVEALIGKTRYTYLEDAIYAANNIKGTPADQIKIDVMKDLTKSLSVDVGTDKNIKLNLNGFTITNTLNAAVIENRGKLEIVDEVSGGSITSPNVASAINNEPGATLTITEGNIINTSKNRTAIYNNNGGVVNINGGTITQNNYGNAIFNDGGILNITGGDIIGPRNSSSFGVYNSVVVNSDVVAQDHTLPEHVLSNSSLVNDETYYFVEDEFGILKPNNQGQRSTIAHAYYELDLRGYSEDTNIMIEVESYASSETNCDMGYVIVNESTTTPAYNSTNGRIAYQSGDNSDYEKNSLVVQGGKLYYVHIGYRKDSGADKFDDNFYIKKISYNIARNYSGETHITGGNFSGGYTCYFNNSEGIKAEINGGTWDCTYSAYNMKTGTIKITDGTFNNEVFNEQNGNLLISGGTFKTIRNYKGRVDISGGEITNFYNKDRYVSWSGDEYSTISGGTFTGTVENAHDMQITGGTFLGELYHYGAVDMHINHATFDRTYDKKSGEQRIIIVDTRDIGSKSDVYIDNSSFDIDVKINNNTGSVPYVKNITMRGESDVHINNTTMDSDIIEGSVVNNTNNYNIFTGLYTEGTGDIYIDKSSIINNTHSNNGIGYGIYNGGQGDIFIGNKDNVYNEDDVTINVNNYALYNTSGNVKFYDGHLTSLNTVINSTVNEVEDGYFLYLYDADGKKHAKLSNEVVANVLNVDTNISYSTLGDAILQAGNGAKLRLLNNIYEVSNSNNEVKSNQTITIDLNGKELKLGNGILNNGNLTIINETGTATVQSKNIINNNVMNIEAGVWNLEVDGNYSIQNNGLLNMKNTTINPLYYPRYQSLIQNNGTFNVNEGTLINIDKTYIRVFDNTYTGTININNGTINVTSCDTSDDFDSNIVRNIGGTVNVKGGDVEARSCVKGFYNTSVVPEFVSVNGNNKASNGSISLANELYVPIDLTEYSGNVTLEITYYLYGGQYRGNVDFYINNSTDPVTSSMTPDESVSQNGMLNKTFTKEVTGNATYYLHAKGSNIYITSIKIKQNNTEVDLFKKGKLNLSDSGYINDTYSRSSVIIENINGITNITGGTLNASSGSAVRLSWGSSYYMNGGTINHGSNGVYANYGSHLLIDDGTLVGTGRGNSLYLNDSDVVINDIDITNNGTAIQLSEATTLEMNGGTIDVDTNTYDIYGITNRYTYDPTDNIQKIDIKNVTINVDSTYQYNNNSGVVAGLYIDKKIPVTINNSTIAATAIGTTGAGIYVYNNASPTITLSNYDGDADGYVSQTTPVISGTHYGIYRKAGTFNFYDGIIKGATAIYGGVSDRPDGYELVYGTEGDLETVVLEKKIIARNTDLGIDYTDLNTAFGDCLDGVVCNIELEYPYSIPSVVTVPKNKLINFDLNDLTIITSVDKNFVNNGNITITNGTLEAQSVADQSAIINNNGTLNLDGDLVMTIGNLVAARLINNYGSLYVNQATLNATSSLESGKYNGFGRIVYNNGGYVEINTGASINYYSDYNYYYEVNLTGFHNTSVPPEYTLVNGRVKNVNGTLESDSSPTYYIPIDLSEYSGNVDIEITYSRTSSSTIKGYFKNEIVTPTSTDTPDLLDQNTTEYNPKKYVKTLSGGDTYYLYLVNHLVVEDIRIIQGNDNKSLFKRGLIKVNGGTITDSGTYYSSKNYNADFVVTGGTFNDSNAYYYLMFYKGSHLDVTGGTFNKTRYQTFYFEEYSKGNISNATINTLQGAVYAYQGDVILNNNTITCGGNTPSTSVCFRVTKDSYVEINGGTTNYTAKGSNSTAINIEDTATVTLNNTTINTQANQASSSTDYGRNSCAYLADKSTININNSTLIASNSNPDGYSTAIMVKEYDKVNINIDNNDSEVSTTKSLIQGGKYAIYRSAGTFKFYDGILKAPTPLYGGVTEIPTGYNLTFGVDGTNKTLYLSHSNVIRNVDTTTEYDDINSAIGACTVGTTCNLLVLSDVILLNNITIPTGYDVNLNINGKKIIPVNDKVINNSGTLSISNGNIEVQAPNATSANPLSIINNNGTLNINSGTNMTASKYHNIKLIDNKYGTVNVNGGTLTHENYPSYSYSARVNGTLISNLAGTVNINNGTFNAYSDTYYSDYTHAFYNMGEALNYTVDYAYSSAASNISTDNGILSVRTKSDITIPIDLSDYTGDVDFNVEYQLNNSEAYIKIKIDNSQSIPSTYDYTDSNINYDGSYHVNLTGQNTYYLHISGYYYDLTDAYIKDSTKHSLFNKAIFNFNNGTINDKGDFSSILSYSSYVNVSNGSFNSSTRRGEVFGSRAGTFTNITGGTFTNKRVARIYDYSRAYISGITASYDEEMSVNGLHIEKGIVTIENSTMTNDHYSPLVFIEEQSKLTVNSGTYTNNSTKNSDSFVIKADEKAELYILGGSFTNNSTYGNSSAIRLVGEYNKLTLGDNDGLVSIIDPHLTAKYGIYLDYDTSTLNIYDGVITTDDTTIRGTVDNVPHDYHLVTIGNDTYLQIESHIENTFQFNGVYYTSLPNAITAVQNQSSKTGTIKVWNDVLLDYSVTIPSDITLTLALEGHAITFDGPNVGIVNNGILTVIADEDGDYDSDDSSTIANPNGTAINNNGTFTLGAVGKSPQDSPIITGVTGVTGNAPTVVTGRIINTPNNSISNGLKAIVRFFASLFQPTYAYKTNDYQVNNLSDDVVLTDSPSIKAVEDLSTWTNQDINVGMTAHNYGVLNIVSSIDDSQKKVLKYTVELYKENNLVDTVVEAKSVQVLSGDKIEVDKDFFNKAHSLYSGFYLNKVYLNDEELSVIHNVVEIDDEVSSGAVFKLYYREIPQPPVPTKSVTKTKKPDPTPPEPEPPEPEPTEPQTEETKTVTRTRTTEEVKGDDIEIHVKEPFPWWIVLAVVGGLGIIGLLIWLLPILLRKKVLIGISGSVGSAVAAKLLQEKNYKVSALFINNGKNLDQLTYARQVCDKLGIDLYEQDITQASKDNINKTITSYPTIDLDKVYNKYVLIDTLKMVSKDLHIGHISCGVYARKEGERIIPGVNQVFDESEKMSLLSEEDIKKLVLPLGEIEYQDINKIAEANNVNYRSEKVDAKDKIGINNIPNE